MSRLLSPWALALACLALALRIVAPQGYMIAQAGEAHGLPVVLCTAQGLVSVVLDDQGEPGSPEHDQAPVGDHAPCVFAATGAMAWQPPAPMIFAVAYVHDAPVAAPRPDGAPGRGLSAPPPPQTGPPAFG